MLKGGDVFRKIYYDLIEEREKIKNNEVVFVRVEQLYHFLQKHLHVLKRYKNAKFIWCQEEPKIWELGIQ